MHEIITQGTGNKKCKEYEHGEFPGEEVKNMADRGHIKQYLYRKIVTRSLPGRLLSKKKRRMFVCVPFHQSNLNPR